MYILINRESLHLLHKHNDVDVLCNLAWLEVQEYYHVIGPARHETFRGFTDMELKVMYRNITGEEINAGRFALIDLLCGIAKKMPETEVVVTELEMQASSINEGVKGCFTYVLGAKRPALRQSLFEGHKCLSDAEHKAMALANKWLHLAEEKETTTKASTNKEKAPSQPRSGAGTLKTIIWNTADEMWEAIGSPCDKAAILTLRRSIMDRLEKEENIKRTSASSELGNWHKTRAPF